MLGLYVMEYHKKIFADNKKQYLFIKHIRINQGGTLMGKTINVTFLHPTNGQDMEVEIDDSMTASAVINELIACNFIPDNSELGGYRLLIKNSQIEIGGSQTVASGKAKDGGIIRVIATTEAGDVG
jgi:hypothetical protein